MRLDDLAFVGTRTTAKRNAQGRGIEVFDTSTEPWTWLETVPATNPSFLTLDRRHGVLHAVHGDGATMSSYRVHAGGLPTYDGGAVDGGRAAEQAAQGIGGRILEPLGEQSTEGRNPAHIVIDPTIQWGLVTNHSSGTVVCFRITEDGTVEGPVHVLAFTGEPGPFTADQTGPKPHQVVFVDTADAARVADTAAAVDTAVAAEGGERSGSLLFLVPDKGLDTVFRCRLDLETGRMSVVDELRLRQGCGPRHLVVHPDGEHASVLGELGNTVTVISGVRSTQAPMTDVQVVPTLSEDDVRDSRGGEIVLGSDGTSLWATNRSGAGDSTPGGPGSDTVGLWSIGKDGRLRLTGHAEVGGTRPRFATLDPSRPGLDIALERSHRIVRLGEVTVEPFLVAEVNSPVCIVFGAC
jgi:6-phosphogluconolactonase